MTGSEADAVPPHGSDAADAMDAAPLAGRSAVVVTCSTRAAAGVYPDRGGALLVETLRAWGAEVPDAVVVPDGPAVAHAIDRLFATPKMSPCLLASIIWKVPFQLRV